MEQEVADLLAMGAWKACQLGMRLREWRVLREGGSPLDSHTLERRLVFLHADGVEYWFRHPLQRVTPELRGAGTELGRLARRVATITEAVAKIGHDGGALRAAAELVRAAEEAVRQERKVMLEEIASSATLWRMTFKVARGALGHGVPTSLPRWMEMMQLAGLDIHEGGPNCLRASAPGRGALAVFVDEALDALHVGDEELATVALI